MVKNKGVEQQKIHNKKCVKNEVCMYLQKKCLFAYFLKLISKRFVIDENSFGLIVSGTPG